MTLKRCSLIGVFLFIALPSFAAQKPTQVLKANLLTQEEYDLKLNLERGMSEKIHQALPGLRFSLIVNFRPYRKLQLSILGSEAGVREKADSALSRVEKVFFHTDRKIPEKTLSLLLDLPTSQIVQRTVPFTQLESQPQIDKDTSEQPEPNLSESGKNSSPGTAPEAVTPSTPVESQNLLKSFIETNFKVILLFAFSTLTLLFYGLIRAMRWVRNSIDGLGHTLSEKGVKTTSDGNTVDKIQNAEPQNTNRDRPNSETTPSNENQILAFFAECYWSEKDAWASALVRRYPNASLYSRLSFGYEYLEYLRDIDPIEKNILDDAYFVSPRSEFYEISVIDTPRAALRVASEMRVEAASISGLELLKIQDLKASIYFPQTPSPRRILPKSYRIRFASVEEEANILISDISEEIKQRLPSLYRVLSLTPDKRTEVLESFSANELAQAWLGPEEILRELSSSLSERKRLLLAELTVKVPASRDSKCFKSLLRKADSILSANPPPTEFIIKEAA